LLQMMEEFGLETVDPLADEIIARSENALRSAIREIPNGVYENEVWSDGFEEPLRLKVAVTVNDDSIDIDFDGSSKQSERGINVVLNYTKGYASFAVKAAISPEVPHNEGAFRPVNITAPEGTILNCRRPAAVASRHLVGHFLPGLILGALADVIPDRVLAGGADPGWMSIWRATWPKTGKGANFTLFQLGGTGARPTKDGLSTTGFPSGVGGVPAEVIETQAPIVQLKREMRIDSGGAGKFRGGLGQSTDFSHVGEAKWSISGMIDRTLFEAQGLMGGEPGAIGEFKLNGEQAPPKTVMWMAPDAVISLNPPGGGGYGDRFKRDPERVLEDVVAGYVSIEAAREQYGVVILYTGRPEALVRMPEAYRLDMEETTKLREALSA
ncbi:MAG: hydantoinase B/oxoprolinase family protein, partial [Chloroflexota bacterium]